jgi:wobble nucleotide-excising tRNase
MIKRIKSIRNFGSYSNYRPGNEVHDFSKFNLFYGWNGSGKSTFSRFMQILSKPATSIVSDESGISEFEVELLEGHIISNANLSEFTTRMLVFNQDFIKDNINWDEAIKSILLISEERIEDRANLKRLNENLGLLNDELRNSLKESKQTSKEINKFLTETASTVKTQFQKTETDDKYYFNYNKTKVEKFLEPSNSNNIFKLDHDQYEVITKAIKPVEKKSIQSVIQNLSLEELYNVSMQASVLLKTPYVSYSIEKLQNDSKLRNWVEEGLHLHTSDHQKNCEFCGCEIPINRWEQLHKHFNDEYLKFKDRLSYIRDTIKEIKLEPDYIPHTSELYEELQPRYNQLLIELHTSLEESNLIISKLYDKIVIKIEDPFSVITETEDIEQHKFPSFEVIKKISGILDQHNKKTDNYQEEVSRLKNALESHLVAMALEHFKYYKRKTELSRLNIKAEELEKKINQNKREIDDLEASLSSQFLGAHEFNKRLHAFLGRKDITLEFDSNSKGYRIIRNRIQAKNLSEGEKTAIAFVYFITKLKENGNEISDNIIVVDDPISSFDSNNLFHAYSYLKNECQGAKQLFVLTHNFSFYKLIRDWMVKKNKTERGREPNIKARFYSIEANMTDTNQRNSKIFNASDSLLKYHSEYHYIFSRVYRFKDATSLTLDEAFLVANLSRKLLESFLSFKFPKGRNDFSQLLDATQYEVISKEKIYRFINKYSHYQSIEFGDDPIDNLLGESQNVVTEVLELIKNQDERHYSEMIEISEKIALRFKILPKTLPHVATEV